MEYKCIDILGFIMLQKEPEEQEKSSDIEQQPPFGDSKYNNFHLIQHETHYS